MDYYNTDIAVMYRLGKYYTKEILGECSYEELERLFTCRYNPDSTALLNIANIEWENREERKMLHPREHWVAGWISGYLTSNPQPYTIDAIVDIVLEDLSRRSCIGIAIERIYAERGCKWLRKQLVSAIESGLGLQNKNQVRDSSITYLVSIVNVDRFDPKCVCNSIRSAEKSFEKVRNAIIDEYTSINSEHDFDRNIEWLKTMQNGDIPPFSCDRPCIEQILVRND